MPLEFIFVSWCVRGSNLILPSWMAGCPSSMSDPVRPFSSNRKFHLCPTDSCTCFQTPRSLPKSALSIFLHLVTQFSFPRDPIRQMDICRVRFAPPLLFLLQIDLAILVPFFLPHKFYDQLTQFQEGKKTTVGFLIGI